MSEIWEPLTVDIATAVSLSAISRSRIYELLSSGEIQSKKIGKRRLIVYASLKAFLTSDPTTQHEKE